MVKTPSEPKAGHVHDFSKLVDKKVLIHDESKFATGEEKIRGVTAGYDILKQRQCKCGATETYDLQRTIM